MDLGRIICKTPHFATFDWFLPHIPFIFNCFSGIYLPFLPMAKQFGRVWRSLAQQLGRTELGSLAPPDRKKSCQERIEFWQDGMIGPPK